MIMKHEIRTPPIKTTQLTTKKKLPKIIPKNLLKIATGKHKVIVSLNKNTKLGKNKTESTSQNKKTKTGQVHKQ